MEKLKMFEEYHETNKNDYHSINEAFTDVQRERISKEFFDKIKVPWTVYDEAGGMWYFDRIRTRMKPILKRMLEEMREDENTRNFAIRFMKLYKKQMNSVTINTGTYIITPWMKEERIKLTNIINRELNR